MTEIALIGKKIGMTREFYKSGKLVPVTVIKMEKARVIQVIEKEKRGYKAVQLGYGKIKNSKLTKAMKGYFAKKNTEAKKKLKEYRVLNTENYKEGKRDPAKIKVYRKIRPGVWVDMGFYNLIDGYTKNDGIRDVFKFLLEPTFEEIDENASI